MSRTARLLLVTVALGVHTSVACGSSDESPVVGDAADATAEDGSGGTDVSVGDATGGSDVATNPTDATDAGSAGEGGEAGGGCGVCAQPNTCGGGGDAGVCGHPACTSGVWSSPQVIHHGTNELRTTLAIDREGGLHVLVGSGSPNPNVEYLYRAPGTTSWTSQVLLHLRADAGNALMDDAAIAVDASGGIHVVAALGKQVRYSKRLGAGQWSLETVDTVPSLSGESLALALDETGTPHVAYRFGAAPDGSPNPQAMYATRSSGGLWTSEFIGPSDGFVRILVDAADLHVLLAPPGASLTHARRARSGGSWAMQPVSANIHAGFAEEYGFGMAANGELHATFSGGDYDDPVLSHAIRAPGGAWSEEVLRPAQSCQYPCTNGGNSSLVVDSWGQVHVAFEVFRYLNAPSSTFPFTKAELYAGIHPSGGAWSSDAIDTAATACHVGGTPAVVLDPWNGVHVVYTGSDETNCKGPPVVSYMYRCP